MSVSYEQTLERIRFNIKRVQVMPKADRDEVIRLYIKFYIINHDNCKNLRTVIEEMCPEHLGHIDKYVILK